MKKFLFSILGLAVALTVTAGVANAAGPHDHGPHSISCTGIAGATCTPTLGNGHALSPCTIAADATTCSDVLPGLGRPGVGSRLGQFGPNFAGGLHDPHHVWPYPGLPGGFPQLLPGGLLNLQALGLAGVNLNVGVCQYQSWQNFDAFAGPRFGSGWAPVRNRWFGAAQAQAEWAALRNAANCGNTVVVPSGLNGLLQGNIINLQQLGYGVNGLNTVNVCQYSNFDQFQGFLQPRIGNRWGGFRNRFGGNLNSWRHSFSQLRMQAACAPSAVVVPGAYVPAAPAPVTVPDPAPATAAPAPVDNSTATVPAPDNNKIIVVPQGSVDTGDSGLAPDAVVVG